MLSPPWDIEDFSIPIISGSGLTVPAYPEDKLRNHIQVLKEGGFKVILRIQVCCSSGDISNKDAEWWNNWYDEYNDFVKFHADLSREEGVDAMLMGSSLAAAELPLSPNNPAFSNSSAQWQRILTTARTSNAQIGFDTFGISGFSTDINSLPWPGSDVDFFGDLDFLGVALWGDVANSSDPTQNDINLAMKTIFDNLDYTNSTLNLPIVFSGIAYQSKEGSGRVKGPETFYTWGDPADVPFNYSSTEQAMIYEAIMQETAKRAYIKGIFSFGYWYVDAPTTIDDMSIRDKMAERIYVNWLKFFPNTTDSNFDYTMEIAKNVTNLNNMLTLKNIEVDSNWEIVLNYSNKMDSLFR